MNLKQYIEKRQARRTEEKAKKDLSWLDNENTDDETVLKLKHVVKELEAKRRLDKSISRWCIGIFAVGIGLMGASYFLTDKVGPDGFTAKEKRALAVKALQAESVEPSNKDLIVRKVGKAAEEAKAKAREELKAFKEETEKKAKAEQEIVANAKPVDREASEKKPGIELPTISAMVDLNMRNVKAILGQDGRIVFIGEDGRWAITEAKLFDLWAKKEMTSIDDIRYATSHIPLADFGLKTEGLNILTVGQGSQKVTAFVDPQCSWCHALIKEAQADDALLKENTFYFYIVPALGDESNRLAKRLFCAKATNDEKLKAFLAGPKGIDTLVADMDTCQTAAYDETLMAAQLLGVKGVPFVVAPDGRFSEGKPSNLRAFVEGSQKK